jgi:nucleotide-binding universal stress UspA family protein
MKTLITTDGSATATTAMLSAVRLLKRANNQIEVVCVTPELRLPPPRTRHESEDARRFRMEYYARMERNGGEVLRRAREALQKEGIQPRVFARTGSPGETIVELAGDYDVVVAGAQSKGERPGPGLGPVASAILAHTHEVTLISRDLSSEHSFRILAGVDGSAASRRAIEALVRVFNLEGSSVTLMHVIEKPWLRLELEQGWYDEVEPQYAEAPDEPEAAKMFLEELRREGQEILEEMRKMLAPHVSVTDVRIEEGIAGNELLAEAETGDYDLAVAGATGIWDLKRVMLGSLAFKLASHAPCSVAIVR